MLRHIFLHTYLHKMHFFIYLSLHISLHRAVYFIRLNTSSYYLFMDLFVYLFTRKAISSFMLRPISLHTWYISAYVSFFISLRIYVSALHAFHPSSASVSLLTCTPAVSWLCESLRQTRTRGLTQVRIIIEKTCLPLSVENHRDLIVDTSFRQIKGPAALFEVVRFPSLGRGYGVWIAHKTII